MPTDDLGRPEPRLVRAARALAEESGFAHSSSATTGRLLATLSGAASGTVGESGTGCGFGTAWLRHGLRDGSRLVTVEWDSDRAKAVAGMFDGDAAVTVLTGDWTAITEHAPFALLFLDGGGKRDGVDRVADLIAPGGVVVMDDFTPADRWPPHFQGEPDGLRIAWLTDPRFTAVELMTSPTESVIVATRR
ncbi:O-methyltransferase [Rugosimonospora africana]|uniref:Transferase n=1 Tax=Rugosimonospora africana TaxID=556532 RepID=A0A8J3VU00_9ACTN|nr:class I SAM-dependent methyltransferase [Rugosimonospora africana]GIH18715.1 transferase [Rugosimonospora africana]